MHGAWFLGAGQAYERVKSIEPDAREELARAFEAAGDGAAQLLLLPPAHARRVIEEMMPTLPEEIGDGPSTILTRGLLWAAVGLDAPPRMSLRVVVQSQDQAAAEALRSTWLDAVRFLSVHEGSRQWLRNLEEVVELTTPEVENDRLVITLSEPDGSIEALSAVLAPPVEKARARAQRDRSMNNLKQLGLAMHNYHDTYLCFPPAVITDADGKPMRSWRVAILPFIEQAPLYEQYDFAEPWDGPNNRALEGMFPPAYRCPSDPLTAPLRTSYVMIVGEGTIGGDPNEAVTMASITDGTSYTILAVEVAASGIHWMEPRDLTVEEAVTFITNPAASEFTQVHPGGVNVLMADGSVRFLSSSMDPQMLRSLLTRNDGQAISGDF